MKLNLGCGTQILDPKEWVNVDLHYIHPDVIRDDMVSLKKINGLYDLIYCAHAIMYVPNICLYRMFLRWRELLKANGKIIIEEATNKEPWEYVKYIRHPEVLIWKLSDVGFKNVKKVKRPEWSRHKGGYCIEGIR